jgi:hypothetical protein
MAKSLNLYLTLSQFNKKQSGKSNVVKMINNKEMASTPI